MLHNGTLTRAGQIWESLMMDHMDLNAENVNNLKRHVLIIEKATKISSS
jgi:N-acetylmuramic acid 6-phosphate (MurNAc-6-P) etherase